jgi:hypothetical protein
MMVTAKKVLDLIDRRDQTLYEIIGDTGQYDYTSIGICLTKVFEKEMNLSLVHWIRKVLGVRLPRFYNKPDYAVEGRYLPDNLGMRDPRYINFNKGKDGKWVAPGIGESKLCFTSLKARPNFFGNFTFIPSAILTDFLPKWSELAELRNRCAHTELVELRTINRIIDLLKEINDLRIFEQAFQMKVHYRS